MAAIWDLNADLGEGDPDMDERLLGIITSANVACGGHAGDDASMSLICAMAATAGVAIGAQVSYVDREGFGRRQLDVSADLLAEQLAAQLEALSAHARAAGTSVTYIKPHGALYHAAIGDEGIADAVLRGTAGLPVLTLPFGALADLARQRGIDVHGEAFADRGYLSDGRLVPRTSPAGALLTSPDAIGARVRGLVERNEIVAADGTFLTVHARSICVHSDTPGAASIASVVRTEVHACGARLEAFAPPMAQA